MSSRNKKHIHKYYKSYGPSGQYLWTCAFMDCSHHLPKHYEHTIQGKGTVCWGFDKDCVKEFPLDERALRMDKPLCEQCDPDYLSIEDPDIMEKLIKAGLVKDGE